MGSRASELDTLKSITRDLREAALSLPLRVEYQCCNLIYTVVGYLATQVSGRSKEDIRSNRIWNPLEI